MEEHFGMVLEMDGTRLPNFSGFVRRGSVQQSNVACKDYQTSKIHPPINLERLHL